MFSLIKFGLALSLGFFLFVGNMAQAGSQPGSPVVINMENWAPYYQPYVAEAQTNTPILWKNPTASWHTIRHDGCVKEGPCLFNSGSVAPNKTFTLSGLKPGRYPYHCELHPIMRGELIIEGPDVEESLTVASVTLNAKD